MHCTMHIGCIHHIYSQDYFQRISANIPGPIITTYASHLGAQGLSTSPLSLCVDQFLMKKGGFVLLLRHILENRASRPCSQSVQISRRNQHSVCADCTHKITVAHTCFSVIDLAFCGVCLQSIGLQRLYLSQVLPMCLYLIAVKGMKPNSTFGLFWWRRIASARLFIRS